MTSSVIALQLAADVSPVLVGGKALVLGRLLRNGFRVPDGIVLTATLLTEALSVSGDSDKLGDLVAGLEETATDASEFRALVEEVNQIMLRTTVPDNVHDVLEKQFLDLVNNARSGAVVVRSSAAVEDSSGASAAGQFSTFLNIRNKDALMSAVTSCWASFYTDRSIRYRKRRGIPLWPPQMGVIIQKQVSADVSGIAFTSHPQRGAEWLAVESSWGFGEPIVGGRVTPDLFEVNKRTGEVVSRCGSKRNKVIVKGEDMVEVETGVEERSRLSISPEALDLLCGECLRVEASLGSPQDIEFSLSGGLIFLLQSRPITTIGDNSGG